MAAGRTRPSGPSRAEQGAAARGAKLGGAQAERRREPRSFESGPRRLGQETATAQRREEVLRGWDMGDVAVCEGKGTAKRRAGQRLAARGRVGSASGRVARFPTRVERFSDGLRGRARAGDQTHIEAQRHLDLRSRLSSGGDSEDGVPWVLRQPSSPERCARLPHLRSSWRGSLCVATWGMQVMPESSDRHHFVFRELLFGGERAHRTACMVVAAPFTVDRKRHRSALCAESGRCGAQGPPASALPRTRPGADAEGPGRSDRLRPDRSVTPEVRPNATVGAITTTCGQAPTP